MKVGAKGAQVKAVQRELMKLYTNGVIPLNVNISERITSRFGQSTQAALKVFAQQRGFSAKKTEELGATLDASLWQELGLSVGETWQDFFMQEKPFRNGTTVNMKLINNTVDIAWKPRFIVFDCAENGKKTRISTSDPRYEKCVRAVLGGVARWDSTVSSNPNPLVIHGVTGQVAVKILDKENLTYSQDSSICGENFAAKNYRDANVVITIGRPYKAIVWDAFFWRRHKKLRISMSFPSWNNELANSINRTIEHEFGHVLGLFDAYGYSRKTEPQDGRYHYGGHPWPDNALPPAYIDGERLRRNSVMVCDYCACNADGALDCSFTRTNLDYEMLLLAWQKNRLQLFADSILGKRSQAFYY